MIETFTPEQIAVIAQDKDRIPSANDLFVRYEDHTELLAEAKNAGNPFFQIPSMSRPAKGGIEEVESNFTAELLSAAHYASSPIPDLMRFGRRWEKDITDKAGIRYIVAIDVPSGGENTQRDRRIVSFSHFKNRSGEQHNYRFSIDLQSIEQIEDHFERLWNHGSYIHQEEYDLA
ncbi:hypothetical protein G6L37_00205 [Agrobacterium rubi]|nr:hypothetical protein [Agrobacterium rubi]NTF23672.1 hypothetical protein [Agrobacterium rubi]